MSGYTEIEGLSQFLLNIVLLKQPNNCKSRKRNATVSPGVRITAKSAKKVSDERKIRDGNVKRIAAGGREVKGWRRGDRGWSWTGCENVFLAWDRRGDKGEGVEVIDMFVQRAEDCRDTTVGIMSEAVPPGDGTLGQCGHTTNEEMVTETWLMSRGCAGSVGVLLSDKKYLLWTNRRPFESCKKVQASSYQAENRQNAKKHVGTEQLKRLQFYSQRSEHGKRAQRLLKALFIWKYLLLVAL